MRTITNIAINGGGAIASVHGCVM